MPFRIRKADRDDILDVIGGILDQQDSEIIVVREKGCKMLYANYRAQIRLEDEDEEEDSCKTFYAQEIQGLCENCPYGGRENKNGKSTGSKAVELKDKSDRVYNVNYSEVEWMDGKTALVIYMRDITQEKEIRDNLYSLAYIDQLTGIPNRQRLKEDYSEVEEQIEKNQISGALALFDLDNFKAVNDTYGHNTGDIILRRLSEHLTLDKAFEKHLYRLGGDEFVLFYTNPVDAFKTDDDLMEHYKNLISGALQTYTLPNISLKCTLSIGVSFFPKHGTKFSDIVRKADIAMYQAKTAGRNQVFLFEDQYDVAKKFKDLYINIQPILLVNGKTYGYELIDGESNEETKEEDVVSLSEFNRAMDALGLSDINNKAHYFISYSKQLLNPAVLENLPRDKFIITLPITKSPSKEEITSYIEIKKKGYQLALSGMKSANTAKALISIASYCKISINEINPPLQRALMAANPGLKFVVSGVDTASSFDRAKNAGFTLFQGFFFNQPVIVKKTKDMDPLKVNYLRLLKLSSTEDYMDFKEISTIISSDVALTYKLLRILNSAAVGLRNVSNMAMAVTYLGEESLKKWIAVLALRGIGEDKPLELVRMSLIRARFGELLAPYLRVKRKPEQVFMVGMLSLLNVALEKTKEQMLEDMPVSEEIRESLLTKDGIHSELLQFFVNFEYANWDEVSRFIADNQMDSQFVNDSYISSVKWYNELTASS